MDIGMDTGDIILKETVDIGEEETTGELWERLSKIGGTLLVKTLQLIEQGKAPREKQPEDFTLAPMLTKEIAHINWEKQTALEIKNLVRGLNPIMGAYTFVNDKKIKLWKVHLLENEKAIEAGLLSSQELNQTAVGEVLLANDKQGLLMKAKDAIIEVIEMQVEGSKKMQAKDYLRGNKL